MRAEKCVGSPLEVLDVRMEGEGRERTEACNPFAKAVRLAKDVRISVEEGKQYNIHDCQVQREENYNRLAEEEDERSVQRVHQPLCERLSAYLYLGDIPTVAGNGAQVLRFPFEENRRESLGLEKHDEHEDEPGDNEGYPVYPAPGHERGLADEPADYGPEDLFWILA